MAEHAQYNQENMPMKDILAEIREMVSNEAQARYDQERELVKTELLILRPEARVDLLLQEAMSAIDEQEAPSKAPEPDEFIAKLQAAVGITDQEALEALIRKVFREEMTALGDF